MNIKKEVAELKDELISLRRDFHKHPELGFEEFRTGKIVAKYLKDLGLEVEEGVAQTGVVGLLKGDNPGKTLMLRTDMDALPVEEETGLDFASLEKGKMHACGHDGHLSMMLIAAKILSKKKDKIKGNIKFVFQPNEEDAGAHVMIDEGVLEDPKVDAALGMHLWSPIESGKLGITAGPLMASSYYFTLTVNGMGGHGGAPHTAINPILPGIDMMKALQEMVVNEIDALKPTIVTFGKINSGTSPIIIPEKVVIEGSLRCLHDGSKEIQERFREIVEGIAKTSRTKARLEFKCGNTLLNNDEAITSLAKRAGKEVVGEENILDTDISVMLGEDFSEFSNEVPSTFIFVGVADEKKGTDYPHHHPKFNIDEDSLALGVEMHVRSALEYLS
ncbi:MAG: M20 metallopeptidase family protein [Tissierella sp.]|uniref:M20 metallopeptidase family protein n=1 Tax=Tissierella sp. TaxID=41274 RepID=UPI003F9BAFE2